MKGSLVTSTVLHAAVICWALLTLSGPRTLDVADVDALPVDIVPVQSITQVQKGEKKAPAKHPAAPKPTSRPDTVKNAQEVGDNKVDLKGPPTPKQSPKEVKAAAPPKSEKPSPKIDDTVAPEPKVEQQAKQEPAPATEVAALPQPKQAVEPQPTPKEVPPAPAAKDQQPAPDAAQPQQSDAPQFASLPADGPTPEGRPQPPQAQTAKTPERKKPDAPAQPEKSKADQPDKKPVEKARASTKKTDFNADKISALLNREEPSGGGAKRSTQEASLGADRKTSGEKLSQSEMDALRGQIEKNWNIIPGLADGQDVRVQVTMRLDPAGAIVGNPQVTATGGSEEVRRTLQGSALRAVLMSSPFKGLPPDKYNAWSEVVVNFDPSQLF